MNWTIWTDAQAPQPLNPGIRLEAPREAGLCLFWVPAASWAVPFAVEFEPDDIFIRPSPLVGKLPLGVGARGVRAMSISDQFWQYAKEAVLAASYTESDDEKQELLDLARTWTQAALIERRTQVDTGSMALAA